MFTTDIFKSTHHGIWFKFILVIITKLIRIIVVLEN